MPNPLPPSSNPTSIRYVDPNIPLDMAHQLGRLEATLDGMERRTGDKLDAIIAGQSAQGVEIAGLKTRVTVIEDWIDDGKLMIRAGWKTGAGIVATGGAMFGLLAYFDVGLKLIVK